MGLGIDASPLDGSQLRIAVVVARWNAEVVEPLLAGALAELRTCGVSDYGVHRVPGAFELPLAAKWLGESESVDAIVALGAVVRGDTPHFEYVAGQCAQGIAQVALQTGRPVIFGVLTTNTLEQALLRANPAGENKGGEAVRAAIEMALLRKRLVNSGNALTKDTP